mgnify:CR=1 FL=1
MSNIVFGAIQYSVLSNVTVSVRAIRVFGTFSGKCHRTPTWLSILDLQSRSEKRHIIEQGYVANAVCRSSAVASRLPLFMGCVPIA